MNKKIKVAEMFAGVGGFNLGLSRASDMFEIVWADQWEPGKRKQYAFEIYKKHFKSDKTIISNKDISNVNINTEVPDIDMIVGGFPCQDYSVAHSGAKGIEGKKGVLWWQVERMIKSKSPKYLLLENVDRLLTSPGVRSNNTGRDFAMILRTLNDNGYGVQWRMINAADYGFPQRRRRTFIFAFQKSTKHFNRINKLKDKFISLISNNPFTFNLKTKNQILEKVNSFNITDKYKDLVEFSENFNLKNGFKNTGTMISGNVYTGKTIPYYNGVPENLGDILDNNPYKELFLNDNQIKRMKYFKGAKDLIKTRKKPPYIKYRYAEGSISFPDDINKPSRTMVTSEHSMSRMTHIVPDKNSGKLRLISPSEAEKLNTFPAGWTEGIPNSARYFTMGNALVVNLVRDIAEGIIKLI